MADPAPRLGTLGRQAEGGAGLSTQVELHDHEQLEIRFAYRLGGEVDRSVYLVDTYLFVPRNVGVNRTNYSKDEFYADVTPLMRLDAEVLPLAVLADPGAIESPLSQLEGARRQILDTGTPPATEPLAVPVKLYAHLFAEAVRAETRDFKRHCELAAHDAAARARLPDRLDAAIARIEAAMWSYRRMKQAFAPWEVVVHRSFVDALRAADEYMSLFVEERLAGVVRGLKGTAGLFDGTAIAGRVRLRAAALARRESDYRLRRGYLRLTSTDAAEGEQFTYQSSLLKKSVQQALYLETRSFEADDAFVRNAIGATGAAIAAVWAFATQVPTAVAGLPASTKFLVVLAAVAAYVLKDRIKIVTNEALTRRLRKYDHKSILHGPSMAQLGLGMLKLKTREAVRFLRPTEVPDPVLSRRLSRRQVRRLALLEEVIHHRKEITAEITDPDARVPEGYWLRDLLRLNVRHFLVRLDEPLDRVDYFDARRNAFGSAMLPKVYTINLILALRRVRGGAEESELEHLRVVLDKNGIVRVERQEGAIRLDDPTAAG